LATGDTAGLEVTHIWRATKRWNYGGRQDVKEIAFCS
jgi:hypothetical protein